MLVYVVQVNRAAAGTSHFTEQVLYRAELAREVPPGALVIDGLLHVTSLHKLVPRRPDAMRPVVARPAKPNEIRFVIVSTGATKNPVMPRNPGAEFALLAQFSDVRQPEPA